MRILICSYHFYPHIGGIETAGMMLATALAKRGYDITVVTMTAAAQNDSRAFPFSIVRAPSALQLLRLFKRADLMWHNHVSLRLLWPILFVRRPVVFVHHCPLTSDTPESLTGVRVRFGAVKRAACLLGRNAFVSEAFRKGADLPGPIIYNTYDEVNFHEWPDVTRDRDVVFLGRLVPQKGADILIDALALLAAKGVRLRATIIGSGPQASALQAQASAHRLGELVEFTGELRGKALARTLARHRLMAMPSRWFEGVGISAIEALACGCVVVGTECGGLPEAIGPAGAVVAQDSAPQLAAALERLTLDTDLYESYKRQMPQHLTQFSQAALMRSWEQLIGEAADDSAGHAPRPPVLRS